MHYILVQLILHNFLKVNLLSKYDLFCTYVYATHLYSYWIREQLSIVIQFPSLQQMNLHHFWMGPTCTTIIQSPHPRASDSACLCKQYQLYTRGSIPTDLCNCSCTVVFFDLGSVGQIQPFHRSLGADVLSDTAGVQLDAVINSLHTCVTNAVVTAALMSHCTLKHVAHYDKRFGLNPNCQHL